MDGILLLDKPAGLSSNAALQRARRAFRAAKAGHTGSLDPLATGLLPLCFGQATKLSGYLLDAGKTYRVTAAVGACTTTGDAEGEVTRTSDPTDLRREALEGLLPRFTGPLMQRPPMYSALKHQGRRLYELAREGKEVERPLREVTVHSIELLDFAPERFTLELACSKGTYVRTLVEDLAAAAGQCAHVAALRRTALTPFTDAEAIPLDRLEARAEAEGAEALDGLLLPPAQALAAWPQVTVGPGPAFYLSRGQAVQVPGSPTSGRVAVQDLDGRLLAVAEIDADGRVAPRRWLG